LANSSSLHHDKKRLLDELRRLLRAELAVVERLARETADAANHPEARPENDKDTRKVELSYLAAGQAARARQLETAIAMVGSIDPSPHDPAEPVRVGSLVTLEIDGKRQRLLLCPAGGGTKIEDEAGEVSVVNAEAPLGRGLLGRTAGESFELPLGGKTREVDVVGVE
jgi:transcription elongation GreA/GreB family factor